MLLLLALTLAARADAIMGPPEDCPPGSRGESSHAGAWCGAATCDPARGCGEGQVCEEVSLCVDRREVPCGGRPRFAGEVCTFVMEEAVSSCDPGDTCERGVCETATRCVPAGLLDRACGGCATPGAAGGGLGAAFALLALPLAARRRR